MSERSIRLRLWSAAAISILVALAFAGVGLVFLFERHVERRIDSDLAVYLNQLIAATKYVDGSPQVVPAPPDPRFNDPLSGYYWQVQDLSSGAFVRSRSLWDATLQLPPPVTGGRRSYEINGVNDELLLVAERTISDISGRAFRAAVAENHGTVTALVHAYASELAPALLLLGGVLILAIYVQIAVGLAPLEKLRAAVSDVVSRRAARLSVAAPREVRPLADEINRLLDAQDKALARARSRATDLAHGLKTPLQVLSADIQRLRDRGQGDLAVEIEKSADAIHRHIELELARARLAPGLAAAQASRIAGVTERIVSVVKRTPQGERLLFQIEIPIDLTVSVDEGDLSEILGNLVENAARYAASTVTVAAIATMDGAILTVADNGPGIADADKDAVLARGVRLDAKGGSGLGLAIVADIVDAYGGHIAMSDANPGLRVAVTLPRRGT